MTRLNIILILIILAILVSFGFLIFKKENYFGRIFTIPYTNFGGIETFYYKIPMRSATNTPCSIQSPNATSTIVHASVNIFSSATSSLLVEIGKAINTGATTTLLARMTLAANTFGTLVATSSLNDNDNLIVSPKTYVNTRFGRPSGYANSYNNNCEVILRTIN